jgi:hypothetical protein
MTFGQDSWTPQSTMSLWLIDPEADLFRFSIVSSANLFQQSDNLKDMSFSSIVRSEFVNLHPNLMALFVLPNSLTFPPHGDQVSDESFQFRGDPDHDAEIDAKILLAGQFGVPVEDFLRNDNESFGALISLLFL